MKRTLKSLPIGAEFLLNGVVYIKIPTEYDNGNCCVAIANMKRKDTGEITYYAPMKLVDYEEQNEN